MKTYELANASYYFSDANDKTEGQEVVRQTGDRTEVVGFIEKVDGNNRAWTFDLTLDPDTQEAAYEAVDGVTFRSAKKALEALDASYKAARKAKKAKAAKPAGSTRGGRSLVPGMTLDEAYDAAGAYLSGLIASKHAKDGGPVDVFALVEDELVMADMSNLSPTDPARAMGSVLREYLAQDRQDRYNFILRKVYQATGRHLAKRGLDRKTATA